MLDNRLLLLSGNDIPFLGAGISIHQPTLKEIAYIGETEFHIGTHFLLFDKNFLSDADKRDLENFTTFNIFMSIMNSSAMKQQTNSALMILTLIFPNVSIKIDKDKIILIQDKVNYESSINEHNFEEFQDIIRKMFCLDGDLGEGFSYNPGDAYAQKIAEKLKKRQQKLSKQQQGEKIEIFPRFISILAVGLKKDINELSKYTVYQINDEFKRFQMKSEFDIYLQAKMAGASDLEEVANWMDDIHSKKK